MNRLTCLAAAAAVLLAACGQKGALQLPDEPGTEVAPPLPGGPATTSPVEQADRDAARPRRAP